MSSPTRGVLAHREEAILDAHILRPDDWPWGLGRFEMFDAPEIDDDSAHDEKVAPSSRPPRGSDGTVPYSRPV